MSFWILNGGSKIIVGTTGKPINCDVCPCEEEVVTECCDEAPLPATLYASVIAGCACIPASTPLVYDALGVDGAGWYSDVIDCNGHDLTIVFRCVTPPQFTTFIKCDAAQNGHSGNPISCDPFEWTGNVPPDGVCCEGDPTNVVLTITE